MLAVKINKTRIDNYKFSEKKYNELNVNFAKSFFNDFSNFYIQRLANKHKLQKNYEEINNYINKPDVNN